MAHYHFQNQRVINCDALAVNCSIEPLYSSLDDAMIYRGKEQQLESDFRASTTGSRARWRDRMISIPIALFLSFFP